MPPFQPVLFTRCAAGKALGGNLYICCMQVDDALIDKLSRLAMLHFDEAEKSRMKADLEKMIAFVDKLRELDTTGVAPLQHMSGATALREDEPGGMLSREAALQHAAGSDGTYFLVPKMIQKQEQP